MIEPITTFVTHANCADGIASALIARDAIPGLKVLFVNHNTRELDELKPEPGMVFCDMTPPRARAHEFVDAGVWVLDHHEAQKDIVAMFGERGIYCDAQGVSGATLALWHIWEPRLPLSTSHLRIATFVSFASLIGIRDCWLRDHQDFERATALGPVLKLWPFDDKASFSSWQERLEAAEKMGLGETLLANSRARAREKLAEGHRFDVLGKVRVVAFEGESADASEVADIVRDGVDLVMAWSYRIDQGQMRLDLSLRSKTFHVGAMGKHFGGGGHSGAGGFSVDVDAYCGTPYLHVARLVKSYFMATEDESAKALLRRPT